jgi:hypothetical protein
MAQNECPSFIYQPTRRAGEERIYNPQQAGRFPPSRMHCAALIIAKYPSTGT